MLKSLTASGFRSHTPRVGVQYCRALAVLAMLGACAVQAADGEPAPAAVQVGIASYYHDWLDGKPTASGEPYDRHALSAAHPSLPFGTRVKITSLRNKRSVVVVINDRLPSHHGRLIDLSYAAARELAMLKRGLARVRLEVLVQP